MARTTLEVDEATAATLQKLKTASNAKTNAEVIRKAIALASVASGMQDPDDRTITLIDANDQRVEIVL